MFSKPQLRLKWINLVESKANYRTGKLNKKEALKLFDAMFELISTKLTCKSCVNYKGEEG